MSGGFQVDPDALDRRGEEVRRLSGRVGRAADAGSLIGPDDYGLVGRVFAGSVVDAAQGCARGIGTLARAGADTATALAASAAAYRSAEASAAAGFRRIRR